MTNLTAFLRKRSYVRPFLLFAVLLTIGISASARGKPAGKTIAEQLLTDRPGLAIPDPLKPWIGWALHDKEAKLCPPDHGADEDGVCTWPARLGLSLRDKGGTFSQSFLVYRRDWVPLPGSARLWPQDVRVDGKPAVVATATGEQSSGTDDDSDDGDGKAPTVLLEPGTHVITGSFLWDEMPESLPVPPATGLITLTVRGKPVPNPSREEGGQIYLHKEVEEQEEEVLELTVHRKVTDEIPLVLTTRISLRIAGKSREVTLGKALPLGFVPLSLHGGLPARLEADSHLKVQVRPGSYELTLEARHSGPISALQRPAPEGQWPADELWVFAARPELRVVTVEGRPPLDPQQTTLPSEWKALPVFPMHLGDTMRLREERRGDQNPVPDRLKLQRQLWLDFDGGAYTAHDLIAGTLSRSWRLEVNPPTELGRAGNGDQDQVITKGQSGKPGIELRQGHVALSADSRILRTSSALTAVSWDADFDEVSLGVELSPGWRLLYASGADEATDTWVQRYTLLDLFLILLLSLAVGRLFGIGWGIVTLVALGLACTEPGAPRWIFLGPLIVEALSRVWKTGIPARLLWYARLAARVALVLVLVGFSATQARHGLHPATEHDTNKVVHEPEEIPEWLKKSTQTENAGSTKNKFFAIKGPPTSTDLKLAREAAKQSALKAGVLGILREKTAEQRAAREDKEADEGESLLGSGRGGGGTGEGTIGLGNLGTIGRGSGSPPDAPKSEPAKKRKAKDDLDSLLDSASSSKAESQPPRLGKAGSVGSKGQAAQQLLRNNAFEIDPNATVQTGPGLPRWSWVQAELRFRGPVKRDQVVHLYLVPPWLVRTLLLGQVALLALLGLRLCGVTIAMLRRRAVVIPLLLFGLLHGGSARAEYPSDELLENLQERILQPPSCRPSCASSSRLQLVATARSLRLRMEVGAAAATSVPLPGSPGQWLPTQVLLDGKPAAALRLADDHLWLAVSPGSHLVVLEGPLPRRDTVQLALPLKPHRVESSVKGWQLDGVHEGGLADDDLQLSRVGGGKASPGTEADGDEEEADTDAEAQSSDADSGSGLQPSALPPFVIIEREIQIGQKWQVATRVLRKTPTGSAVVLEVPLLPGESVTTAEVRVQNGKALVNMGPTVSEVSWRSLLQEKPRIELFAPKAASWSESWRLTVSPIYHVEYSGSPVIHRQDRAGLMQPEWRPWPDEKVVIDISRPDGIAGRTLTIDHSRLQLSPGMRATDATLSVELRTSRGGPHSFGLPSGAQLLSVEINDKSQPLQSQGDRLLLNLLPGEQSVVVRFQLAQGIAALYRTPQIDLGAPSVNADLSVQLGPGRWVLFCAGPPLGPAVLFWSLLLVMALTALGISRFGRTPLRPHQLFLLGLGLTQVPVPAAALVLGWLLALAYRQHSPHVANWLLFNLRQLFLLALTIAALFVLFVAIENGLLGKPEMHLAGNDSTPSILHWSSDRSDAKPATGLVFSLPLRAYQAAMLGWALWLAQALLGWLRWGYAAFTAEGLLKSRPRQQARPLPQAEPPLPQAEPPLPQAEPQLPQAETSAGTDLPSATTPVLDRAANPPDKESDP